MSTICISDARRKINSVFHRSSTWAGSMIDSMVVWAPPAIIAVCAGVQVWAAWHNQKALAAMDKTLAEIHESNLDFECAMVFANNGDFPEAAEIVGRWRKRKENTQASTDARAQARAAIFEAGDRQ